MDAKALYAVRLNSRNINGYNSTFEVFTGFDADGNAVFGEERDVPPGRQVLALTQDAQTGVRGGAVYRVNQGERMVAIDIQPVPGDLVRIHCSSTKLPQQAGTAWMLLEDGEFVPTTLAASAVTAAELAELEKRVPLPPPVPEPLPPEGDEVLDEVLTS